MIRASPVIGFFSVVLASIYPAACTWAGGSALSQGHHSPARRHLSSEHQCPDCNKEFINPVIICVSNHILCEHCASGRKKRHRYCCPLCGKALMESFVALADKNARYLESLNRRQTKPRHGSSQRRSRQPYHPDIHTLSDRANQLSKNTRDMDQLAELARSLPGSRELGQATAIDLALLVNSISKLIPLRSHKRKAEKCISRLSQEIARRDLREWREQSLAMAVSGLSKVAGGDTTEALKKIAKVVRRGKKAWTEQQLAMLANGLSKAEGKEITGALKEIAQEVTQKDVKRWTEQDLVMLISGLGTIAGHPAFSTCVNELVSRQNSKWWLTVLGNLCRLQLSEYQAQAGLAIMVALDRHGFEPEDRHQSKDIVWCLTLLHFVFDKQDDEVSCQACQQLRGLYDKFAGYPGYYPVSSGGFDQKPIDDLWQEYYARDYWKEDKSLPVPPVTYPINGPSISRLQKKISGAIEKEISRAKVREEVCINGFPVDMLIGEKVCVEIDGSGHYIYSDQPGLYDSTAEKENPVVVPLLQKYLRAKDHFIVHMLEKYGYSVFRIPYDMRTESRQFQHVIQDIQESLSRAD